MDYKDFITDLHVNLHPDQLDELDKWYNHCRETLDFFTLAYYPYEMADFPGGMHTEAELSKKTREEQWSYLKNFFQEKNREDAYLSFIGYEWQGSGEDGDHNVYFKETGPIEMPLRYTDLVKKLKNEEAIGIPHHLAYQLGHRGKNWATHDESFSPFTEIYSSHGSSESGYTDLPMDRHPHMGPRTGGTSVFDGLLKGAHVGIIASGDNHVVPGMVSHGRAGIWAKEYSKEGIWEAFKSRRTFGFTKNKISVWLDMDNIPMGSIIKKNGQTHQLNANVIGNNKINRIELIKDGDLVEVITNLGNKVKELANEEVVTFKFKVECGWGPNLKLYPDLADKIWNGVLTTEGEILSVEKDYNSFGATYNLEKQKCDFSCISHETTQSGVWMGASPSRTEGFIFEIKAKVNSKIKLTVNGKEKDYLVKDILENTDLLVFYEDAVELATERFGFSEYFRSDPFYHNAYKVRVNRGSILKDYMIQTNFEITESAGNSFYLIKVYQTDGQVAWSSPIWLED